MGLTRALRRNVVHRLPSGVSSRVVRALPDGAVRWYRARSAGAHDVFLVSPPKAGRTWLRLMTGRALQLHFGLPDIDILELHELQEHDPRVPAILATHDDEPFLRGTAPPVEVKSAYRGKPVVLLVRDPRDVVVSMYFHKKKRTLRYDGDLADFLADGYFDRLIRFYNIWAANRDLPSRMLLVRYEDLHADPLRELKRLFEFLELDEVTDETLGKAVSFSSFDNMRKLEEEDRFHSDRLGPAGTGDDDSYKTRKGVVAGFRQYLSPAQIEACDLLMRESLSDFYGYDV